MTGCVPLPTTGGEKSRASSNRPLLVKPLVSVSATEYGALSQQTRSRTLLPRERPRECKAFQRCGRGCVWIPLPPRSSLGTRVKSAVSLQRFLRDSNGTIRRADEQCTHSAGPLSTIDAALYELLVHIQAQDFPAVRLFPRKLHLTSERASAGCFPLQIPSPMRVS